MTLMRRQHPYGRARRFRRAGLTPPRFSPGWRRAGGGALCGAMLLLLAWQQAGAQLAPASTFFNGGAQFYISNNVPAALDRVETGLKLYPDDVKLKKIEELLKQQQQQQSQQNQQQQNQQNQQNQQQQSQKNQQQQQQQQNSGAQPNQQQQQQPQQAQNQSGQKSEAQAGNEQQANSANAQVMSPEEAKRLLDTQKDSEQFLQYKPQGKPRNLDQPIKDW